MSTLPQPPSGQHTAEAIYCLGNDAVYEWLVAFCQSIRDHEGPDRQVFLIPFDERLERVRTLQDRFGLVIIDDPRLAQLEELGLELRPESPMAARALRKLLVFFGPAERFVFIDADAVLLRGVAPLFEAIAASAHDFYFLDEDLEQVYVPGAFRDKMVREHGARGFNSGIFGGTNGSLSLEQTEALVRASADAEVNFVSRFEQSLLNYVVDTSPISAGSFRDVIPGLGGSWAGLRLTGHDPSHLTVADSRWIPTSNAEESPLILHWAGYHLDPFMPYRSIYRHYRLGNPSVAEAARFEAASLAELARDPRSIGRLLRTVTARTRSRVQRRPSRVSR